MKILLIVPDGLAIRTYLYSDFVAELKKQNAEVMVYHYVTDQAIDEVKSIQKNITKFHKMPDFVETPKIRFLRESLAFARLLYNKKILKNETIMMFWNRKVNSFKRRFLYVISEKLGSFFSKSYQRILKYDALYENEIGKHPVIKTIETHLDDFKPDYVLNLIQRSQATAPIINVAKKRGIKTGTVIFSWDNVPKARLVSRYDNYFVWSDLMKNDLALLYPEIKPEQIKVVGTPQFEFYFKSEFQKSKEEFFTKYGLDCNKRTICFSANDMASPYEQNYFQDLCEELSQMDESQRPQILFRNCPVDKTQRFQKTLEEYQSFVFQIAPDWRSEASENSTLISIYPSYHDFELLANTVKHSDLVINLGSTMAHDFAVYDKPCLYLNYNPVTNSTFKVEDVFNFQHFKSMKGLEAVEWINSKSEFIPKIAKALEFPEKTGKDRAKWMQRIVQHPLADNSKSLANQIISLCTSAS